METLHWENHNPETFNVFIRDLSMNLNANLKYMIEDLNKKNPKKLEKSKKLVLKRKILLLMNKIKRGKRKKKKMI